MFLGRDAASGEFHGAEGVRCERSGSNGSLTSTSYGSEGGAIAAREKPSNGHGDVPVH